ncbi:MAG: cytochrome-c peroxidase [Chitinophagales bacterium]|nr:cytochrome-c peroxidase [Chitinophagaceae bacterium]MCB9064932.1 cytochrome-c peroxidase [Chitinophagales bacterium]
MLKEVCDNLYFCAVRVLYIVVIVCFIAVFVSFSAPDKESDKLTIEQLGEMLFFDPILSEDLSISCASCHKPEYAFADTSAFSVGVHGRLGNRNTPSAMNVLSRETLFWDGRAATLAEQALGPIENPVEMNLSIEEAITRLNNSKYKELFKQVYGTVPNKDNLGDVIAAFEATLETSDTPNDRWINDEPNGMSEQQLRGRSVFRTKGKCLECHFTPDFTGDEFRSIGLFNGKEYNDSGRYNATKDPKDIGLFKVPGLRNVAVTAPYMHDGSMKTLREVIDYYDQPHTLVPDAITRDSLLREPLNLTEQEKQDLESFLHALTDDRFVKK